MRAAVSVFSLLCLVGGLVNCGPQEPLEPMRKRLARVTPSVQTWQVGPEVAAQKKRIVDTVHQAGRDDKTAALLVAMAMAETEHLNVEERDKGKDNTPSMNWSIFNANSAMLGKLGWVQGQSPNLNDGANLEAAVGWMLKAIDQMGEDKMMCFHRGGECAFNDMVSYGAQEYIQCMRAVQAAIIADPSLLTDSRRAGMSIQHV